MPGPAGRRLALVGLGTLVVPLDTAVNVAFPDITAAFGLALADIQWVVIAYVLTYGALVLAVGRFGDVFGHARVFRAGLAWSAAALLLCAAAPTYGWLLAGRVLQGMGGALLLGPGVALATAPYPEAERGRVVGLYTLAFAIGSALGPLLGGALVERWGWPAVFWARAPVALLALALLRGRSPAPTRPADHRFDAAGAALLSATMGALLLALSQARHLAAGGTRALWLSAAAVAGLVALRWRTRRHGAVLPLRRFRDPHFALINAANVLVNLGSFAVLLFVPYWLAGVAGLGATAAGLLLATSPLGLLAASPASGALLRRGVRAPRLVWAGAALAGAGLALVAAWGTATPLAWVAGTLLVQGFGLGLVQVGATDAITGAMPREERGVAGSLAMLGRTLGIVAAASLLPLPFAALEAAALSAGAPPGAAFLAAFRGAMLVAAAAAAVVLAPVTLIALAARRQ